MNEDFPSHLGIGPHILLDVVFLGLRVLDDEHDVILRHGKSVVNLEVVYNGNKRVLEGFIQVEEPPSHHNGHQAEKQHEGEWQARYHHEKGDDAPKHHFQHTILNLDFQFHRDIKFLAHFAARPPQ